MNWEQYEVWQKENGSQEILVDTTKSYKEAKKLAQKILEESSGQVIIFREADDFYDKLETLTIDDNGSIIKTS